MTLPPSTPTFARRTGKSTRPAVAVTGDDELDRAFARFLRLDVANGDAAYYREFVQAERRKAYGRFGANRTVV